MDDFTGWDMEREQDYIEELTATSTSIMAAMSALAEAPIEINPTGMVRTESQGRIGSCQGHAITSVCEYIMVAQKSRAIQLSRAHGYYGTQRIDGLLGRDVGSTIAGGVALAKRGICDEALWPYRDSYDARPPQGHTWASIEKAAEAYRLKSHTRLMSYDDVYAYNALGLGAITIGIQWNDSCYPSNGVIENYTAGGRGGHAVMLAGYSRRRNKDNEAYIYLLNSHGKSYGVNGWVEVSPRAIRSMLAARYTVMIGCSDMAVPARRTINWVEMNPFAVSI